ncbi:39S ribosomal protein L47, mitochondrial [Nilaparvata lugens]|uniref:39S ribosomal protein L47, mitochondrial n=1 Tax=Nilaparvata lugens TaxID=108931 RepID=UPI00193D23D4|nr:39S ribosomal protein L47, mitochondrial [Nilaparvata lugens]
MFLKNIFRSVSVVKDISLKTDFLRNTPALSAIARVPCQYSTQITPKEQSEVKPAEPDYDAKLSADITKQLMQFFDEKDNWGAQRVYVGRAWKKEELRLKSSTDLHKLWYVLLKEKNMLFTMEHECKSQMRIFPNPERIDKVLESMDNLEEVVRERNKAFHLLETGETGERPFQMVFNKLGLRNFYRMFEHIVPKELNEKYKDHIFFYSYNETKNFVKLFREKLWVKKRRSKLQERRYILQLFKRFPNVDKSYLKELYPDQDIEKLRQSKLTASHLQQKAN